MPAYRLSISTNRMVADWIGEQQEENPRFNVSQFITRLIMGHIERAEQRDEDLQRDKIEAAKRNYEEQWKNAEESELMKKLR